MNQDTGKEFSLHIKPSFTEPETQSHIYTLEVNTVSDNLDMQEFYNKAVHLMGTIIGIIYPSVIDQHRTTGGKLEADAFNQPYHLNIVISRFWRLDFMDKKKVNLIGGQFVSEHDFWINSKHDDLKKALEPFGKYKLVKSNTKLNIIKREEIDDTPFWHKISRKIGRSSKWMLDKIVENTIGFITGIVLTIIFLGG